MMKLMGIRLSLIWLVMAMAATAQIIPPPPVPVLDTTGQPLRRGLEYYINPALFDARSRTLTLVEHNITSAGCPPYVGEGKSSSKRLPITFAPLEDNENVVGKIDPQTQKRLIETGDGGRFGNLFLIERLEGNKNIYKLRFCPNELCPLCKPEIECGNFEPLILENREILMSLGNDGTPLAVQFERVPFT
ncbi:hypothetical protein FEM48_Zijuj12G0123200 [Ziziphus jujuba var. spinosa]|uniref:Miraculin-like n=1 Tax=Ziziphus jujuba var. spinosa TaxID=714518 RepID=A0A978UDA4_ZIZJJ|nr:hypothetical protein FEM48_Zijuj12G0123200 [Ziziphus jujuba var. spinosa]